MIDPTLTLEEVRATIALETDIDAPADIVFQSILEEVEAIDDGKGGSLKLKLERWPGGRWFRDTGNNTGHLWGHVQVIKPPIVLEITGPLMMSIPVLNHVSYRVTAQGSGSRLTFKHRAFGEIDSRFDNFREGWKIHLDALLKRAQKNKG